LSSSVLALTAACGSSTAPTSESASDLFEVVWSDFDRNYAFFPILEIDWNTLHAAYRDSIDHATSMTQAARLIGGMIKRLGDRHAVLFTPSEVYGWPEPSADSHFNPSFIEGRYFARPVQRTSSRRLQYTRLTDGTGYVYIGSFEGDGWGEEIDGVLADLAGVPGIIIDIRNNGGGNENVASAIAARFYDKERVYRFGVFRNGLAHTDFGPPIPFTVRPSGARSFKGPIALITNRWNGSAAEDFVLMIAALPQAVTVGDTTCGVGSHPLHRTLPNGWTYWVPQSQETTPAGFVYNFKGLPPSISVPWDVDVLSSGREPYIEAALAELKRRRDLGQP
jgi:C-terminal processing protease CtpA/Prc